MPPNTAPLTFNTNLFINLQDVEKVLDLQDLNNIIKYERVFKPDDEGSPYFLVHYRNAADNDIVWNVKNGLLSNEFSVVNTDMVLNEIQTNLDSQLTYREDMSYGTYSRVDFVLNGVSNITEAIDKKTDIIFKLLTNISPNQINESSALAFTLLNAFGGEQCLTIYYGLLTSYTYTDEKGQSVSSKMNNLCILNQFTKKLIHNHQIEFNFSDVIDVKGKIIENINRYYNKAVDGDVIKILEDKLPKKFYKQFAAIYENVTDDMKNLYYVSYIFSFLLQEQKSLANIRKCAAILESILSQDS